MAQTPTDPTKAQVWITKGIDDLDFEFYIPSGPKGDPGGLTLGTNLGTNNLNDYITSGVYRQGVTADATLLRNYPMDQQSGTMLVIERVTGNTVTQIFYPIYIPSLQFVRMYNNGTWSTWRSFSSTRVDQTAGRAFYEWDAVNNREQLTYGDTGLRDVTSLLGSSWDKTAGRTLFLRRSGSRVTVSGQSIVGVAGVSGLELLTLPIGFRPDSIVEQTALQIRGSGTLIRVNINGAGSSYVGLYTIANSPHGNPAVGDIFNISFSYNTSDPWPTTLPGNSSGSIPNT